MSLLEKISYIRGLTEGLGLDKDKKEAKVISAIIDLLDDMAMEVSDLAENFDDVSEQLDAVDEDLYYLEQDFYDEDGCDCCGEDGDFYEVTCPSCDETICLSEEIIAKGSMDCPNCGENLEFDMDECCCCGEDCECGEGENCSCDKPE